MENRCVRLHTYTQTSDGTGATFCILLQLAGSCRHQRHGGGHPPPAVQHAATPGRLAALPWHQQPLRPLSYANTYPTTQRPRCLEFMSPACDKPWGETGCSVLEAVQKLQVAHTQRALQLPLAVHTLTRAVTKLSIYAHPAATQHHMSPCPALP